MQSDRCENGRLSQPRGGFVGAEWKSRDALSLGALEQRELESLLEELAELIESEGGILIP